MSETGAAFSGCCCCCHPDHKISCLFTLPNIAFLRHLRKCPIARKCRRTSTCTKICNVRTYSTTSCRVYTTSKGLKVIHTHAVIRPPDNYTRVLHVRVETCNSSFACVVKERILLQVLSLEGLLAVKYCRRLSFHFLGLGSRSQNSGASNSLCLKRVCVV